MTTGRQSEFVGPMQDFFWGAGSTDVEVDFFHDTGSVLKPRNIGAWTFVSNAGNFFPPERVAIFHTSYFSKKNPLHFFYVTKKFFG
jgi:hypothetical protein